MINRQQEFDLFMDSFIKLGYEHKCKEIIEKQKRILALLVKCVQNKGIYPILLQSSEINDINKDNPTNDDYVEESNEDDEYDDDEMTDEEIDAEIDKEFNNAFATDEFEGEDE